MHVIPGCQVPRHALPLPHARPSNDPRRFRLLRIHVDGRTEGAIRQAFRRRHRRRSRDGPTGTGIVGASGQISSPVSVVTATGAVVTGVSVVACDSLDHCQATGVGAATAGTLIVPGTALVAGRTGAMEPQGTAAISGTPAASPAGRFTSVAVLSPTGNVVYGAPILDCDFENDCRPGAPPTDVANAPQGPMQEIATLPDSMTRRDVGK